MELDVRLEREAGESWGFRLIGGKDFKMPLTVVKVLPDSAAEKSGLQNGDAVCHINEADTTDMTHDTAKAVIDDAQLTLLLSVKRGLYDPVLDDYEPIYEPIDQEDSDQPSQPTEVDPFRVIVDDQKYNPVELPELKDIGTPIVSGSPGLPLSRSLTSSPYPTKPYRPFSTEPIVDVPPIEDPIILNPNYKDQFHIYDNKDILPETRFKLPISEQYDPDGIKKKAKEERGNEIAVSNTFTEDTKRDVTFEARAIKETKISEEMQHKCMVDEMKFMEKMKQEIDLDNIEMTAVNIVNESINTAVTVAGEIKKEIDVVLSESTISSETKQSHSVVEKGKKEIQESLSVTTSSESTLLDPKKLITLIDKTTEEVMTHNGLKTESNVCKEIEKIETMKEKVSIDVKRESIKQEIEETIESGSVRKKSEAFLEKSKVQSNEFNQKTETKSFEQKKEVTESKDLTKESIIKSKYSVKDNKSNDNKSSSNITSKKSENTSVSSSSSSSKQKAYTIGLQTIPNIKGTIHSSYHYNLLLKTFFIHLTDVMVALSRFILTQPAFDKDESQEVNVTSETNEEQIINENINIIENKTKKEFDEVSVKENKQMEQRVVETLQKQDVKVAEKSQAKVGLIESEEISRHQEAKIIGTEDVEEETKRVTGVQMAQRTEKKSEELTQKMCAVISEFQTKAGIEDTIEIKERRSRSRSRIEEEVAKESDPLEWLSKVDTNQKQEITKIATESRESASSESIEKKSVSSVEKHITDISKSKDDTQMYVAIVESHVFTNKDAIFEETLAGLSETSLVQTANETNIALQATETVSTEKVSMKNKEKAESILEESRELAIVNANTQSVEVVSNKAIEQNHNLIKEEKMQRVEGSTQEICELETVSLKTESNNAVKTETKQETITESSKVNLQANDINYIEKRDTSIVGAHVESIDAAKVISIENQDINNSKTKYEESSKLEKCDTSFVEAHSESVDTAKLVLIENQDTNISKTEIKYEESRKLGEATENAVTKKVETSNIVVINEQEETSDILKAEVLESTEIVAVQAETITEEVKSEEVQYTEDLKIDSQIVAESTTTQDVVIQEIVDPVMEIEEMKTEISQDVHKVEFKEEELAMTVSEKTEVIVAESSTALTDIKEQYVEKAFTSIEELNLSSVTDIATQNLMELKTEIMVVPDETSTEIIVTQTDAEKSLDISSDTLKIVKEQIIESENTFKSSASINEHTETVETENISKYIAQNLSSDVVQESSFIAVSLDTKKSSLHLDLSPRTRNENDPPSTINTPTPSTIPPTPLTDEYVFKLQIPLPKNVGILPIPIEEPEPVEEDPHIVKKKLVPHIETILDSPIIYDPPLPTPPEDKVVIPFYTKPGLRGGSATFLFKRKEEILEIERKSSLLASAIDETIKSIEEYKEEVGIETKKVQENGIKTKEINDYQNEIHADSLIITNGFTNGADSHEEEWKKIDKLVIENNQMLNKITINENAGHIENFEIQLNKAATENNKEIFSEINNVTVSENLETKLNGIDNVKTTEDLNDYTEKSSNSLDTKTTEIKIEARKDPMEGYRPVQFDPEELKAVKRNLQSIHVNQVSHVTQTPCYKDAKGELLGTHQGIVDGLEEAVVNSEIAKQLGKPGMTDDKIAELISGESEMLREAHVMGLTRVITSHMHRDDDDSSVDFKRIKPIIESLKDSEVLKALNDELIKKREQKLKEEKKWTTFLQKPKRPVPNAKFGYYGYMETEEEIEKPYKVQIVKQPKPKVAPDYKSENFETGPLPWEERALNEPPPPPVDAEDPILIPEEVPEFFEAVDPLPESEVPDLEDTGIPLPEVAPEENSSTEQEVKEEDTEEQKEAVEEVKEELVEEEKTQEEEMDQNSLAEKLMTGVQSMVDPSASVDQQLAQMRAQIAALAQLPGFIQQTLELVTKQLSQLSQQETTQIELDAKSEVTEEKQEENHEDTQVVEVNGEIEPKEELAVPNEETEAQVTAEMIEKPTMTQEEIENLKKVEEEMLEEQRRIEKQKKELMEQMRMEQESRQVKQRPTPRVGKPKPVFGPPVPQARPLVLPGGRKWRKPQDAYNEQFIAETLSSQAELIQGKTKGINFMKFEKPPVSLDHLQQSEVFKLIHNMEQSPVKRVEMLTPVIAEADYREKCRSVTPSAAIDNHMSYPQQVYP